MDTACAFLDGVKDVASRSEGLSNPSPKRDRGAPVVSKTKTGANPLRRQRASSRWYKDFFGQAKQNYSVSKDQSAGFLV
jgi:hypothetical protein